MDGINIDDHTIERYLRLTHENQTPSMVKNVYDMTIAEYIEYEERIKRQYKESRVVHKNKNIKVVEADLKNSSEAMEDTVNNDSFTNVSNNVMRRSIYEYLKPDNLWGATMSIEVNDMTQQETLGTVKNVLVKINKFEFPCDFVVTDMPENVGEIIILEDNHSCPDRCIPGRNFIRD
ncbi:phospholipase D beta 1-like protein [Tanacetum coccineum]|uniref:Phospholipase D beta 1-like protein n=1 Tax=Tanacetum coccineum TaxID=301880 RepID=A0ABQ4WEY3_9ASTR